MSDSPPPSGWRGLTGAIPPDPVAAIRAEIERRFITRTTRVTLSDHVLEILHPHSADDLITEADYVKDERLPYWADLWPSSLVLAEALIGTDGTGIRMLELGCGSGLVASAAAMAGFDVLATDYYEDALLFARVNIHRNAGVDGRTRHVDWRHPPDDLGSFDLVVASDVLYEHEYALLLPHLLSRWMKIGGRALVADPGRVATPAFVEACGSIALTVKRLGRVTLPVEKATQKIDVWEIRK